MGNKYMDTRDGTLESSVLGVWQEAAKKQEKLDPVGKEDGDIDNDGDKDASDKYLAKRRKAISKAIKKDEGVKEHKGDKPHKHPHEEKEVEEGKVVFDDHDADDKDFIKLIKKHGLKAKSDGEDTTVTGSPDKIEKVLQTMYGNDWKDMYTRKGQNFENFAGKEVKEYYEIGTDEYRDHTLEVTPGQSLTWGSANAYKAASMKEALAKVWGLEEKKLDKTEEDDKIAPVKGKKTMTGGDVAKVEVDPEKKEK